MTLKDMRGQRFGMLVVDRLSHTDGKNTYWIVRCDCGGEKPVQRSALITGRQTSCGCQQNRTKHGLEGAPVYTIWASMKARCQNPNHAKYSDYGGRGIRVCERWQDFRNFYADMGDPTGILDRINNDGHYEPGNCRWTSWSVSNKNKRPCRAQESN